MEEPKQEHVQNLTSIYTLSKVLDLYAMQFKKTHPTNYLNNKCDEMINACEKYYKAFDRELNAKAIDDLYEAIGAYKDIFDLIFSLDGEQLQILVDIIKTVKENGINEESAA